MDKEKLAAIQKRVEADIEFSFSIPHTPERDRRLCITNGWGPTPSGPDISPAEYFCPTLLNETVARRGGEGAMEFYERRAFLEDLMLKGPPEVGAAGHLLHMLHRSLSQADVREVAGKPGVVEMTFQKADGKTFKVEVTEEMAFDIGYTAALFNLSNPTPATYFHFDPGMQGAGEPIRNFSQQLSPQKSEAELLALAAQCFDKGQNHGALACAAAGEMFASHSFGLPSPVTTTASLKTDDKPAPARN